MARLREGALNLDCHVELGSRWLAVMLMLSRADCALA
jgi:hypothetical protein